MVGEQGPEMFVPNSNGTIIPNHAMGGGTTNIVTNIDARGAGANARAELQNELNLRDQKILREVQDLRRRGRL